MHFLRVTDRLSEEIREVFELADRLKRGENHRPLENKTVALFFPQSSLRTRLSFERGVSLLGGQPVLFPPETLDKREDPGDVVSYMANWVDLIVVRHRDLALIEALAKQSPVPVINAMTGENHPCEILSDLYALDRFMGDYRSLQYTFVGEAGNIARTWLQAAKHLGFTLRHAAPETERITEDDASYRFSADLDALLPGTDVLLTDPLPKNYRNNTYYERYQITISRLKAAGDGVLLNPCPPFYRGEEVSAEAIASDHFVGHGFKKDLLYVQMALMCDAIARKEKGRGGN